MKLKFILPLYLALASATFCGRKITEEKETTTPAKLTPTAIVSNEKITGTLELDTVTNTVYADLWLKVSSHDYRYAHDFMPLQTKNGYKGIAFRYFDTVNNAPDNGKDTAQIHVVFNFINDMRWKLGEPVRVMSLDEESQTTFIKLKPYFLERMDYFKNVACSYENLKVFNEEWNTIHPNNEVTTAEEEVIHEKITKQKKPTKMIPKLTKDDGVLSLRLKK